jgi:hypothetical protein
VEEVTMVSPSKSWLRAAMLSARLIPKFASSKDLKAIATVAEDSYLCGVDRPGREVRVLVEHDGRQAQLGAIRAGG